MSYRCSSCGDVQDAKVSLQGGRRHEFLPDGWSEVTFRTEEQAREIHKLYCKGCTGPVRKVLFSG
jgi:hypothetical protein